MSIHQYNPNSRYKERAFNRFANGLRTFAIISVVLLFGFWVGKQYGAERIIALEETLQKVEDQRDSLEEEMTQYNAAAKTATTRFEQLQAEVESILPAGPMQDLVTLLREQLDNGTDPERLSFVIRSARPPTGCVDPDSKRFVVSTPTNPAPKSSVLIADKLTITAVGEPAVGENGAKEAWYNPAKTVSVSFQIDDKVEKKTGILPLRHSLVIDEREYRFTIEKGARSFAKVVFDSCDYP
ncbi:MAG: hypothetical protein AAF549_00980 [Pseudomonadota bacterium]